VSTTNTTFSAKSGDFVTLPLASPLTLSAGQVYWAALLLRGVPGNQFPFQEDRDNVLGRSWFDVGPTQGGAYNVDNTGNATVLGGTHPVVGSGVQDAGNLILRVIDDPTDPAGGGSGAASDAGTFAGSPSPSLAFTTPSAVATPPTAGANSLPWLLDALNPAAGSGLNLANGTALPADLRPAASAPGSPLLTLPAALVDASLAGTDTLANDLAFAPPDAGKDALDQVFAQDPGELLLA
jgi:hypothetical protein